MSILIRIKQESFIPLFYHSDSDVCVAVCRALYASGVRIIEFTNRGENALKNFRALVAERDRQMKGLLLAVGTIMNAEQASDFIAEHPDFLISPIFDSEICEVANLNNVFWIPGCQTPTEIAMAKKAGCQLIKLYPENLLGSDYVQNMKLLFSDVEFLVTGGAGLEEKNLMEWFELGVAGVGLGNQLISKAILENGEYQKLELGIKKILATVRRIKK